MQIIYISVNKNSFETALYVLLTTTYMLSIQCAHGEYLPY